MLQIIRALIVILFAGSASAQEYNGSQVPAFLRDEAVRNQYEQQRAQPASVSSEPAFLRQEREQQQVYQQQMQQIQSPQSQYQYQSADPASNTFTLPPSSFQPAPGSTPAFIAQEQQGIPQQQPIADTTLKTNKKEDVIQINFSDDQYKAPEEVTTLNKEQAAELNATQKQAEDAPTEIPEGAKFSGNNSAADAVATADKAKAEAKATLAAVPEPEKKATNLTRVTYSKDESELSDKDKEALLGVTRLLKANKTQKITLTANTSHRDTGADARRIGLMRVIAMRDYLMKQGVDFSQTEVKLTEPDKNKEDLDYIDVDKI